MIMICANVCVNPPLLVDADTFLHERFCVGIKQKVEVSPCGNWNLKGASQKLLCRAVSLNILHEAFHVCSEVLYIGHSG